MWWMWGAGKEVYVVFKSHTVASKHWIIPNLSDRNGCEIAICATSWLPVNPSRSDIGHPFLTTYHHHWVQGFQSFAPMSLPTDPSVFNILTLFRSHWFLSRDWLVLFIASAQQTDSGPVDWVEFTPVGHSHLVRCALKLAPSIPIAKVKRVMFVFILEVLNGDGPATAFFAPRCHQVPHAQWTCKPKESGAQPVEAMG